MTHARRVLAIALALGIACISTLPAADAAGRLKGSFRKDTYTSPDKGFSVRAPGSGRSQVTVGDEPTPGGTTVWFAAEFCRAFYVRDIELVEGYVDQAEVERYAREAMVPYWQQNRDATLVSIEPADIGRGPAVAVLQRTPSGPCKVMKLEGGKSVEQDEPAEMLSYVFVAEGAIYEVGVLAGESAAGWASFAGGARTPKQMAEPFLAGLQTHPRKVKLQRNGLRPGIDARLAGRFEGDDYIAPDGSFRLKRPLLHGASRVEEAPGTGPGETLLQLSDSLCRTYLVHRMWFGPLSDDQMRQLAEAMGKTFVSQEGATGLVIEPLQLDRGEGARFQLRYELPPQTCDLGGWLSQPELVPVDFTIYLFRMGGAVYEIGYQRARIDAALPYFTRREPADTLLRELIAGLRETGQAEDGRAVH